MTGRLPFHFSLSCIGEGNGDSLQCSCLENPRDGGAWWAAVYGGTQSRTRLKQLSSSSSSVRGFSCIGKYVYSMFPKFNFSLHTFWSKNEKRVRSKILLKNKTYYVLRKKIPNYINIWVVNLWITFLLLTSIFHV